MMLQQKVTDAFEQRFGEKPALVVRAPGRVNLIGEHTDYNDGFVLPMAIDRAVWFAFRPRADKTVRLYSLDNPTPTNASKQADSAFELNSLTKGCGWLEYPKGIAYQLQEAGYELIGFAAVITGNVPRGAGLSSSAAA